MMAKKSVSRKGYPFLPFIGALLLAAMLGYLLGRIATVRIALNPLPTKVVDDSRRREPTVVLQGIQDGKLIGSMSGEVRMWIGEQQIFADADGQFVAEPGPLLVNTISILIPEGMQFVASSRGKKYYPVLASQAQNLAPENRVYFPDAAAAEAAGYSR
tara:strand:+ start:94 stop:567 length:474 start_codon:yes stop_codon:yes gene_type:complete